MAEVLGVAAGAIGLAGFALQVVDSANKLRNFCSSVKNIPKDLSILLEEITAFSNLVADLANDEQRNFQSPSLVSAPVEQQQRPDWQAAVIQAIDFCREAAVQLEHVLKDLHYGVQKKGVCQAMATVKVILREKQVMQGVQRLERAKSLLSLAQQCLLQ